MELFRTPLLIAHIAAGSLSLILFWVPIFARKGSPLHRKAGRAYGLSMTGTVGTAGLLSLLMFFMGDMVLGSLLSFLALLTAHPLWEGWRILREKSAPSRRFRQVQWFFALSILGYGSLLLLAWSHLSDALLLVFGLIGVVAGGLNVWGYATSKGGSKSWLRDHYAGMLFSGGAAYTAFLAFGARALVPSLANGSWGFLPWILPTTVAFLGVTWLNRMYRPRPARS